MLSLVLSIAGAVLATVASIGYFVSILKGQTRPHRVTWGGWALAGVLGLWASFDSGAKIGLLVTLIEVLLVLITFVLSLFPKYGKPGGRRSDYVVAAIAAAALIAWQVGHFSANVAVAIAIAADAAFLWFTVREAWLQPETEELWPWVMGVAAQMLGFLALGKYTFASAGYPAYILIGDTAVCIVLIIQKPLLKPAQKSRGVKLKPR